MSVRQATVVEVITSLTEKWPGSKTGIERIGRAMRDDKPFDLATLESWTDWHVDLVEYSETIIRDAVEQVKMSHRNIIGRDYYFDPNCNMNLSSRVKTRDTTLQKLRRLSTPLTRIQDIAGLRIDGDFTLQGQDVVAEAVRKEFELRGAKRARLHDTRETPHQGYRGLHVYVESNAGNLEVQIRTQLQADWANTSEIAADLLGRGVRYGERINPRLQGLLDSLLDISESHYSLEKNKLWVLNQSIHHHAEDSRTKEVLDGMRAAETNMRTSLSKLRTTLEAAQSQIIVWKED